MLRFLNIAAIVALIGSAVYAYTIKYQTSYRAEQIAKTKIEIKTEHDAIAVLRAEWSFLTRPERMQQLADKYLDLQPLRVDQIVTANSLPERANRGDGIGRKLDEIGLGLSSTPPADVTGSTTPQAQATPKSAAASTTPKAGATAKAKPTIKTAAKPATAVTTKPATVAKGAKR
jgi:cell division protein FtsL